MAKFMNSANVTTNIYRTRDYIVTQRITFRFDEEYGNILFSHDTYYRRSARRDKIYETAFAKRIRKDGKRIHTSKYARKYID